MANIDHDRKRITAVLLFYGPPGAGKTTSLYALARHLPPGTHGKVAPLQAGDERLLRLDYRPHDHEMVYGYQLSFRLVTCPGKVDPDLTRPVLAAADAVMFVADSASNSLNTNVDALEQLDRMARSAGRRLDDVPIVFMYNKRDLRDALEIRLLENRLNRFGSNYLAASAIRGQGVLEALQRLTATVAVQLRTELASAPGVQGNTASTVAHGTTYDQARALHSQDMDDVTAVSVGARDGAPQPWIDQGSDDRTEVNAGGGWEVEAPPVPAARSMRDSGSMRAAPSGYGAPAAAPRPGFSSYGGGPSGSMRAASQPRQARQPAPDPVYADQNWRTPEAFADIDSDDHTMPYMDFDNEVGSVPGGSMPEPEPIARPDRRGPGPAPATSLRRPASSPRAGMSRPVSQRRAPAGTPDVGRPRRVDAARLSNASLRSVPSSASIRSVPSSRSMRAVPATARPTPPPPPPQQGPPTGGYASVGTASTGAQTQGTGTFTKTMAINALGREAEAWESGIEQSGLPVKLQAPDLSGYVVSRIGTPKAASRRTVRIPVRATHMDTLVPQDFVIDVEFRGGAAASSPAVSARKARPEGAGRQIPLTWFIAAVGTLSVVVVILWFALQFGG